MSRVYLEFWLVLLQGMRSSAVTSGLGPTGAPAVANNLLRLISAMYPRGIYQSRVAATTCDVDLEAFETAKHIDVQPSTFESATRVKLVSAPTSRSVA